VSGFSAAWLSLREPADHRARNPQIAAALTGALAGRESVRVLDLGCGTGSNLRALAPHLPRRQHWRLVDHDRALLSEAGTVLAAWADHSSPTGNGLALRFGTQEIVVTFEVIDLARDLERAFASSPELVTAAALFDLVSEPWIARFARAARAARALVMAALTYDGTGGWAAPHSADGVMKAAFDSHQRRDKGFGPAAGPAAASALARTLRDGGYEVETGPSPWILDEADSSLIAELARGYAAAVSETGEVSKQMIAVWLAARETRCQWTVGHEDLLAVPSV
jgi:SAM-dependent methyltransferase